ncbi:zf-HC2 domain-containing protein [Glaciecola sp. XM2]|uniref:anti-sigma factor family protein n=1 Tax=Glaciecola sp. XM2 TaxID=1914931 RepID=UPI001BDF4FED|nr:zf-HC2 domain-containing protein [Glaciecola sp. XM2]MBT1450065.1 zf-HC2 domain-containing protein [Glaciecola sp. XM2]
MNKSIRNESVHSANERNCDRTLLSAYADNELTQQQRQLIDLHIADCAPCAQELKELIQMKNMVKGSSAPSLEADKIEALLEGSGSRIAQTIAWTILIISLCIGLVFSVYEFYFESNLSVFEKLIPSLVWGSIIGLFVSVARQQFIARKTDKYKGVKL